MRFSGSEDSVFTKVGKTQIERFLNLILQNDAKIKSVGYISRGGLIKQSL